MQLRINTEKYPKKLQDMLADASFWLSRSKMTATDFIPRHINEAGFKPDKVAFMASGAHCAVAIRPVFEEMVKEGFQPVWTEKRFRDGAKWLYVTTSFPPMIRKNTIWISHGVGNEKPFGWNLECTKCLLPGPYWYRLFAEKLFFDEQLAMVGFPKTDILFSPDKKTIEKNLREKYHASLPYEKTILYSPTSTLYSPHNPSFDNAVFPILNLSRELKINLIIKAHPNLFKCANPSIFSKAKTASEKMPNVRWIDPTEDITPLYLLSDVLISDMSSTLREFMLTNKPSIQLTNYIPKEELFQGVILSSIQELRDKISLALENSGKYTAIRQKCVENLFYKPDGHASERTVAVIKEILSR